MGRGRDPQLIDAGGRLPVIASSRRSAWLSQVAALQLHHRGSHS